MPAELEYDEADASAVHAVAYNRFHQALATGRVLDHGPDVGHIGHIGRIGRIGRMAVDANLRNSGVGRQVLDALLSAAESRYDSVVLHAQMAAADFYRRAGFVAQGPVFEEAGIAHIEMVKRLRD